MLFFEIATVLILIVINGLLALSELAVVSARPGRQYLPELIQLIWDRKINPGKVFDLTLPLEQAAEGYRAMDERRAVKVLLTV